MRLTVLGNPIYRIAHPDEPYEIGICEYCLVVVRDDTNEAVILWGCGLEASRTWSVNRATPDFERHKQELTPLLDTWLPNERTRFERYSTSSPYLPASRTL